MTDRAMAEFRSRYDFRCGYCGVTEAEAGSTLTIDHFLPQSRGGGDGADNLVYACSACNSFKGDYWDPDPPLRLLHPLDDDPAAHWVVGSDGVFVPITDSGRNHIARLRLNRPELVQSRLDRIKKNAQEEENRLLRQVIAEREADVRRLKARLRRGKK